MSAQCNGTKYLDWFVVHNIQCRRERFGRYAVDKRVTEEANMGRAALLWLIGIPIPIILLVWLLGGLH